MLKIALLGLPYESGNKGCEALTYSFLEILNKIAKNRNEKLEVGALTTLPLKKWIKSGFRTKKISSLSMPKIDYSHLSFTTYFYRNIKDKYIFLNDYKHCSCVFDFTAGDSFTDIYGEERFYTRTKLKQAVIDSGIPLVLGSQTIGPFNNPEVAAFACTVIKEAYEVYVRDEMSYEYTLKLTGREPVLTSDVAFMLPYEEGKRESEEFNVGFNPSGLLWSGGYSRDNQFGLKVDYQRFCKNVIGKLLSDGKRVHLIPHAVSADKNFPDNDMIAVEELHAIFPETIKVAALDTPMEIKSYISGMDIFIGARMHATIGALSVGTPVIPFSYSRKFEGLFNSLDYEYVINGREIETEPAVNKTLSWIDNISELQKALDLSHEIINKKNVMLIDSLTTLLDKMDCNN